MLRLLSKCLFNCLAHFITNINTQGILLQRSSLFYPSTRRKAYRFPGEFLFKSLHAKLNLKLLQGVNWSSNRISTAQGILL